MSMPDHVNAAEGRVYTLQEERRWNRLSTVMSHFHNHFKHEYNTLYELADGSFNKRGMSLSSYLGIGKSLVSHLNLHHSIEEAHFFPILAKRMPMFALDGGDGIHVESHKGIHKGIDDLSALMKKYKDDPSSYSPTEMRACLDGFRNVLFEHLDQEVADLSSESMKKYWTLEEIDRIQI